MNKVSIIIPVYKAEKYIQKCIKSILGQSYNNFEIIIVNDCTPDNSIIILSEYQKIDDRIVIINKEVNNGTMRARETGYIAATGDYILFCDSDDMLPSDAIEILINQIIETEADIVCGSFQRVFDNGQKSKVFNSKFKESLSINDTYELLLNSKMPHSLWGKIFDANLFRNNHYDNFDKMTNSEDLLLIFQIVSYCRKIICINDVVYYYSDNPESATQTGYSDNKLRQICKSRAYIFDLIKNRDAKLINMFFKKYITIILLIIKGGAKYRNVLNYAVSNQLMEKLNFKFIRSQFTLIDSLNIFLILNSSVYRFISVFLFKFRKYLSVSYRRFNIV